MTFAEIASRALTRESLQPSDVEIVRSCISTKSLTTNRCLTDKCYNKPMTESNVCFDCHARLQRKKLCENFKTCSGFSLINGSRCKKCQRSFEKRCPYFDECGGFRAFDKVTDSLFSTCNSCYKYEIELSKRCLNYKTCKGYRSYDPSTGSRFETCGRCYRKSFDTCEYPRCPPEYNLVDVEAESEVDNTRCVNYAVCKRYRLLDKEGSNMCFGCNSLVQEPRIIPKSSWAVEDDD